MSAEVKSKVKKSVKQPKETPPATPVEAAVAEVAPPVEPAKPKSRGLSITAMTLGIASMVLLQLSFYIAPLSWLVGLILAITGAVSAVAALVFGIIATVRKGGVMAILGLIMGGVGMGISALILLIVLAKAVLVDGVANFLHIGSLSSSEVVVNDYSLVSDYRNTDLPYSVTGTVSNNTNSSISDLYIQFQVYSGDGQDRFGLCYSQALSIAANSTKNFEIACAPDVSSLYRLGGGCTGSYRTGNGYQSRKSTCQQIDNAIASGDLSVKLYRTYSIIGDCPFNCQEKDYYRE